MHFPQNLAHFLDDCSYACLFLLFQGCELNYKGRVNSIDIPKEKLNCQFGLRFDDATAIGYSYPTTQGQKGIRFGIAIERKNSNSTKRPASPLMETSKKPRVENENVKNGNDANKNGIDEQCEIMFGKQDGKNMANLIREIKANKNLFQKIP